MLNIPVLSQAVETQQAMPALGTLVLAALLGSTAPGAGPSSRHTSLSLLYIEGYRGGYCWRSKLYLVAHKMRIVPLSVSTVFHLH